MGETRTVAETLAALEVRHVIMGRSGKVIHKCYVRGTVAHCGKGAGNRGLRTMPRTVAPDCALPRCKSCFPEGAR